MNGKYHLTTSDSSSYATGYDVFLKRTNFREVILKGFSNAITTKLPSAGPLKILDIGCGNGVMSQKYVDTIHFCGKRIASLHLVEPSQAALEESEQALKRSIPQISKYNVTLDSFLGSVVEKDFDLIIASYVFYHLNLKSVKGLISILKPGGALVIMMGGVDHPLRRNPILNALSKHGDSLNLKEVLASIQDISFAVESYSTDLNISGLMNENQIMEDGRNFFSFIYNCDLDSFTQPQLEALHHTLEEINKSGNGIAHPKHEIIWVKRL